MTKRQAPYKHADGSGCWTKNCSKNKSKETIENVFAEYRKKFEAFKDEITPIPKPRHIEDLIPKIQRPNENLYKHPLMLNFTPETLQNWLREKYGIMVQLEQDDNGFVVVDNLIVAKKDRKRGVGTEAMGVIIQVADKHGWDLALTPSDSFGSTFNRLEAFYRRFGFTKNIGRKQNTKTRETMIRYARPL